MKKIIKGLLAITICISLAGCSMKNDGSFTMKCISKKEKSTGMEIQTIVTYNFNKEQLATEYTSETTQIFKDKSLYKTYKEAQQETIKNNTKKNVKFDLKTDDKNKKLVFIMKLQNIDKSTTKEDKEIIKASIILKENENAKVKCTLNGITKDKLK